ncbi:MAG: hypothetical protein ACKO24_08065 [Leptolyngbyaceae cyanobacterium]
MAGMPQSKGYGHNPKAIQSHSLPHAKTLVDRAGRYFGIDLTRLTEMSDGDLSQFADRAIAMKRLRKLLPILEKHFTELIEGQMEYEAFVQRVLKQTEKGAKAIDKNILDAWLLSRGYDKHWQLMNQKAGHGAAKQDAETRSELDLNKLDFNSAIRMIQLKHQNRAKQIEQKVPNAIADMKRQDEIRQAEQQRVELLTYGSAGKPGGAMGRVARFLGL